MAEPEFHIHDYGSQWELYYGVTTGSVDENARAGKCIIRAPKAAKVPEYYPDEQMNKLLLERLNGFPKAITFLEELLDQWEKYSLVDVFELIQDFLRAVPHEYSKPHIESEPVPQEFDVTIARTVEATVNVVATSREEAEALVWERGDQIGEAFDLVKELDGDEAYKEEVIKVEPTAKEED